MKFVPVVEEGPRSHRDRSFRLNRMCNAEYQLVCRLSRVWKTGYISVKKMKNHIADNIIGEIKDLCRRIETPGRNVVDSLGWYVLLNNKRQIKNASGMKVRADSKERNVMRSQRKADRLVVL